MVSNDEKIINKNEKFSLLNIYSQTQINKLIKTVMNAEKLTFGSLCEIINKLSLVGTCASPPPIAAAAALAE